MYRPESRNGRSLQLEPSYNHPHWSICCVLCADTMYIVSGWMMVGKDVRTSDG
ncbi:hypothetical protein BDV35DRAFT_370252 [Aspergillus flavus]|uniref:Uncharacterized protein n=1 Tax=Aspergillus flavus TaxID=5059 RepID=A0A5N6GIR7_ASPFL|nr:hypothetical protein BDV35DRAFT_370252 [Aspergillus flavus]